MDLLLLFFKLERPSDISPQQTKIAEDPPVNRTTISTCSSVHIITFLSPLSQLTMTAFYVQSIQKHVLHCPDVLE